MIEIIYGEDAAGVEDALAEILSDAGPEDLRDVNSALMRADGLTPDTLASAAFTLPFMADWRIVAVKGLLGGFERGGSRRRSGGGGRQRNPLGAWEGFADRLANLPDTTRLVFADGALAKNNPMLRKLAPLAETREFALPRDRDMPRWISERARIIGVSIDPRACAVMADAVGRQPTLIDSELRKLALYCGGRQARVEDVREMVASVREANIFQAVDAALEGRTGVALRLVGKIMDDGSPAAYLMVMIARQNRLLLMAKDMQTRRAPREDIGKRLRLSGWVLNKTLQQAGRMNADALARNHRKLVETDLALKSTPIDERLALELLIAELGADGG